MATSSTQEQKLSELIGRYINSLPERLREITQAWERLKHIEWDSSHIDIMLQGAHKLAGSGKTFQFPDISTSAARLEAELLATQQPGGAGANQQQRISAALDALTSAIRHAITAKHGKSPALPTAPQNTVNGVRITLIEDDADQAALLSEWLRHAGYQTRHLLSPEDYQESDSGNEDIILLDIHFAGSDLDGLSWLEQVRSRIPPTCPIVIMSTRSDLVARMRALRAGATGFVTKPIQFNELPGVLERALAQQEKQRGRILCIDDDAEILAFYRTTLSAIGYQVDTLEQPLKTLHRLEHFRPDMIILDHNMPGCSGSDIAALLRQDPKYVTLPILFVSAVDPATLRRQPQLLVNDCLLKPVSADPLITAVRTQLTRAARVNSHVRKISLRPSNGTLQHEAAFLAALERKFENPDNEPRQQQLLQITVDQHDYLLAKEGRQAVARQTQEIEEFLCNRPEISGNGCVIGPLSFLLLADGTDDNVAENIAQAMRQKSWALAKEGKFTFSIGCITFSGSKHLGDSLRQVEQACMDALKQGGDRLLHHATAKNSDDLADNTDAIALIAQKSFKLMFQPIINLESGETIFETFVRLEDKEGRSFTPAHFGSLVERALTGGAYTLDRWLLDNAILKLTSLGGKEAENYAVVIRLFSSIVQMEKLVPMISNALSNSRIRGQGRVIFAIPESHLVRDVDRARALLEKLQGLRCGVMITDAGDTDFSQHVIRDIGNVDFVKLALRYGHSREGATLIQPLLDDIRQQSGKKIGVIAAGVEDMSVLTAFWDKGVRFFQGYFIQRPSETMQYTPNA